MKLVNQEVNLLKELQHWLDDNVDQGSDILFAERNGAEIKSQTLLAPMALAINALEKNLASFVVVGRVSDAENILLFVEAVDSEAAAEKFLTEVKREQNWDGVTDIYIEFCIPLSEYPLNRIYNDTDTASSYCF